MADIHYTNVRIFDGGGEAPFMGEVLVQGDKIARVVRSASGVRAAPVGGARVVDGAGAFLMPGMVEAHTHFSWNDQPTLDRCIDRLRSAGVGIVELVRRRDTLEEAFLGIVRQPQPPSPFLE